MFKVRTYNQISVKGLEQFPRQRYEVGSDIGHPDAYLLRSHKLHDLAAAPSLLAVAQACQSLLMYQSDMALAGGVSMLLTLNG